jgi:hypothetical protein
MQGLSTRNGARKRTFAPGVEVLEDRRVPALLPPVAVAPGVVQFSATGTANNTLNIFDDGAGHISFSTSSTAKPTALSAAKFGPSIHEIIYNAGPGSDTFTYNMINGAALAEDMKVLVVLPPTGNKGFTANFGAPPKPKVPGSPGTPPTPGVGARRVDVTGRLDIEIEGSRFKDNATLNYAGVVKGDLRTIYHDPQQGNGPIAHGRDGDKVTFVLNLIRGSTGTVHPKVQGGAGDDNLTLIVRKRRASDPVRIFGIGALNGDGGLNKGVSFWPPISEINIQT